MNKSKELIPFSAKPLVPGKGGGLNHWRHEREKQQLHGEITDLAKTIRRLSQELIDQIIFLQDPAYKSPEEIQRAISRMAGALKAESSMLNSLFKIGDLHPAMERIFRDRLDALRAPAGELAKLLHTKGTPDETDPR